MRIRIRIRIRIKIRILSIGMLNLGLQGLMKGITVNMLIGR